MGRYMLDKKNFPSRQNLYKNLSRVILILIVVIFILRLRTAHNDDHDGSVKPEELIEEEKKIAQEESIYTQKKRLRLLESRKKIIPIIVLACDKTEVSKTLDSLIKYRKSVKKFPILVSQDCNDSNTTATIAEYSDQVMIVKAQFKYTDEDSTDESSNPVKYNIAKHYKWILNKLFNKLYYQQAIVLEDDIEVSPDFYEYFESTLPLLKEDETLMCVSSWNDNGRENQVEDPRMFFRTEYFPGPGFMLTRKLWEELSAAWPIEDWAQWFREPGQRKSRSCIRPSVSRTYNFGGNKLSGSDLYQEFFSDIKLNDEVVEYGGVDRYNQKLLALDEIKPLEYTSDMSMSVLQTFDMRLMHKKIFDERFEKQVYTLSSPTSNHIVRALLESTDPKFYACYRDNANIIAGVEENYGTVPTEYDDVNSIHYCGKHCRRRLRIPYTYTDAKSFARAYRRLSYHLRKWHLVSEMKIDVPSGAYRGVVSFKVKLTYPQPLVPPKYQGDETVDKEEYIEVYLAPEEGLLP